MLEQRGHSPLQVFLAFLKLGCMAFGGPVAHLGYFEEEFVRRRAWLSAGAYADLVALCQFLPGPASSQVGFAIGYKQGGITGAFAAWLGFTLPSAVLMIGFALGLGALVGTESTGWIAGLKLAAVAVVAKAVWDLASRLCPDGRRALIAIAAAVLLLLTSGPLWQIGVIAAGLLVGWLFYAQAIPEVKEEKPASQPNRGWPWLAVFAVLLLGLPLLPEFVPGDWPRIIDGFYRAGSLVFGGGHVVLPLLDAFTIDQGWISRDSFLAGYGAAQALPGPLFAFTAFLGASIDVGPGGIAGGLLALLAVYLPSWLLVLGALPYWERLRRMKSARAAFMGANAAVVGLLLAAFYDPIWISSVTSPARFAFALAAFGLLRFTAAPPWLVVLLSAMGGALAFS